MVSEVMLRCTKILVKQTPYCDENYHDVDFVECNLHLFERLDDAPVVTSASAPYAPDQQMLIQQWFYENFLLPKLSDFVFCTMAVVEPRRSQCIVAKEPVDYSV